MSHRGSVNRLPFKIKNDSRTPAFTAHARQDDASLSQKKQTDRKEKTYIQNRKKKRHCHYSLMIMINVFKNSTASTHKMLELLKEVSKFAKHKIQLHFYIVSIKN